MVMQRRRFTLWLAASIAVAAFGTPSFAQPQATVAAASDLKFALEEVSARFEHDTGQKIRLVFGSSGNFYSQIVQGAPFHVFMSADEAFVFKLAEAGKTVDRGRLYAVGRIGIIVPKGSSLKPDGELVDLAAALKDGQGSRGAAACRPVDEYPVQVSPRREHLADGPVRHFGFHAGGHHRTVLGQGTSHGSTR
jgi:molybdate transport system substrate-binding protein